MINLHNLIIKSSNKKPNHINNNNKSNHINNNNKDNIISLLVIICYLHKITQLNISMTS